MDRDRINRRLIELDKKVGWNALLRMTNPANLADERKAVYGNSSYNPTFILPKLTFSPDDVRKDISVLRDEIGFSMEGLEQRVNLGVLHQAELVNRYLEARGTEDFQEASEQIFMRPHPDDVEWAKGMYRTELPVEDKNIDPEGISESMHLYMKMIFASAGIDREYEIKIDTGRANILVEEEEGRVRLPDRCVSADKLAGDNVHEAGIHPLQYEMGCKQPLPAFRIGFPFRPFTSEGLALYNEELIAPGYVPREKTMAGNIIATCMAEERSFSEIYNELLGAGFSQEESFKCTLMAKRGFSDTSKKGANFSRNLYVKGLRTVREYLENGGDEWVLYTGRVSLDYVDDIRKIEGLVPVDKGLPGFIRDKAREVASLYK